MHPSITRGAVLLAAIFLSVLLVPAVAFEWTEENSCVLLNAGNTDIQSTPEACFLLDVGEWCNCTKAVFLNPIKGETTAVEIGSIMITEIPGIGNFQLRTSDGTLDLDDVQVGDSIGTFNMKELLPEGEVPPGTFFKLEGDFVVTAKNADSVDFDVVIFYPSIADAEAEVAVDEFTAFATIDILTFDPTDSDHSDGKVFAGRLTSLGPDKGFIYEHRYEAKPGRASAGIETGDMSDPGFNARFGFELFGDNADPSAADIFTLPLNEDAVNLEMTIRKFPDEHLDEVVPLGEDLCEVLPGGLGEPFPCKIIEQSIPISGDSGNNPPSAVIVATESFEPFALVEEGSVFLIECGEARVLLRGSNSSDGDGGAQGLTYLWEIIEGPEDLVKIPAETVNFQDTEISFLLPPEGVFEYEVTIRLTVDDGQEEDNIDMAEFTLVLQEGFTLENSPPELSSLIVNEIQLVDQEEKVIAVAIPEGAASVDVDFDQDATTGNDGCFMQQLFQLWSFVSGPAAVDIDDPGDDNTGIRFSRPGTYVIRLTLDDGAPMDNLTVVDITVEVEGLTDTFLRGDANGDSEVNISDASFLLNWLFLGGPDLPCEVAGDANADGADNISDSSYLLNFLFLGGPQPPEPYPDCGPPTENDILGCETSPEICQ